MNRVFTLRGSRFLVRVQVRFEGRTLAFGVRGSDLGVRSSGFEVRGSEFGVRSSEFRVGVRGSGFAVRRDLDLGISTLAVRTKRRALSKRVDCLQRSRRTVYTMIYRPVT